MVKRCALLGVLVAGPAAADFVDVDLLVYHAEEHPETGEPCGGAFAGPGLTNLNIFFDNIEFNARDEQETWPVRAFPRIEPGDGGTISVRLEFSPGNPQFNIEPGIQSNYIVRIGWQDRDVISTERTVNLDPYRIVDGRQLYVTRDGWTNNRPGIDYARHGVIICNRPPSAISTSALFQDRNPGSIFIGWRHAGGLREAVDWSRTEVFVLDQPEIPRFGAQPVFTQAAWGSTNRTVEGLDCGEYFICYRNYDHYGHVWEGCDDSIMVDRCIVEEPDMMPPPEPDLGPPDMAVPDMEPPDMAPADMAVDAGPPDMDVPPPPMDMNVPFPMDMDVPFPMDMDVPPPMDMDVPPPPMDMDVPPADVGIPPLFDMNTDMDLPPPVDMELPPPPVDMELPPPPVDMMIMVDMARPDPRDDMGFVAPDMQPIDQGPGDDAPEGGVAFDTGTVDADLDGSMDQDPFSDAGTPGGETGTDDCSAAPGTPSHGWEWALLTLGLGLRRRRG